MLNKILSLGVFALGVFLLQANAQGINVYSAYPAAPGYINYQMGTVSLPGSVQPATLPVNSAACVPFLTTFHKQGDRGVDVAKLQLFLNQYNGAKLNGKGYFGPATRNELRNFQYGYGVNPTGMQYQKTTDLINKLNCGQIAKNPSRTVYASKARVAVAPVKTTNITSENIYPNPTRVQAEPSGVITSKPAGNNSQVVRNIPGANPSVNSDHDMVVDEEGNTFWGGLQDDVDRIKQNYKAYILVFVLVLALFWFLRKAATE